MSLEVCNECEKDLTNEYCIYVCEDCHLQVVKETVACQGKIDELQAENARLVAENEMLKPTVEEILRRGRTEGAESMATLISGFYYAGSQEKAEPVVHDIYMKIWSRQNAK